MAQLMPLPLAVSCSSKSRSVGFTFLVPAHPGSPGQKAVKRVLFFVLLPLAQLCNFTGYLILVSLGKITKRSHQ